MGQLGFCARIFRNVCTFLITRKIELRGRSNLPPDRRLGQRSPAVVCPPPVVARSVFARHSPAIWPCVHSLLLAVVWGRVPARYGASCSRCCPFALRNSVSARRPADCSPWASLLSTPRCLATRSTGAFSCRRSRCLGSRLLPPSAVLAGRGSWAQGVPRG